jgi:hypothetical protein
MQLGKMANIFLVERSVKAVSDYRCKVRIIHDRVITVNAKNKKEAEEEANKMVGALFWKNAKRFLRWSA